MATSVFISSTSLDLKKYRQAAIDTCENLGFIPIVMENFGAMGVGATEGSKRKLREADLFIGIIAHRYGYVEAGYDRSVTEIEFDYAGERGLDRLCFILDPEHAWPKAHVERKNADKLAAFKEKVEKSVIRSLFTSVEAFQQSLIQALVDWQEWRTARSGELDAVFATTPEDIPGQPTRLIGRDDLRTEAHNLLDKGKRVLLQGFGGVGKTALAASLAAERIAEGKGPVLWLRAGTEDRDGLFMALASPFNAGASIAKETNNASKARIIRLLLSQRGVGTIVLDDVWNGRALSQILNVNAVPAGVPVLVTSRHRFTGLTRLDIGRLDRSAAIEMLCEHGDLDWQDDPDAETLCRILGDHAFALRVAAMTMALDDLKPGELLERIGHEPHKLPTPEGAEEEGRASIEELLNASLFALDAEAREVFLAFGAFFTATNTPEIMARYMDWDVSELEEALTRLQRRGLAERVPATEERVEEYRIHDLAYSFARSHAADAERHKALDATLAYLERYHLPLAENFAPLRSELDNFIGAAHWASSVNRYADVEKLANWLYRGSESTGHEGFLHLQGYAGVAITLLTQAVSAAEALGNKLAQATYLGNLGSAYRDVGQVKQGMKFYRTALKIYRDLDDKLGQGVTLGRLGIGYRLLGQAEQAIDHLQQALLVAREVKDKRAEGMNLANLGIAFRHLGQSDQAIWYIEQALEIARQQQDKRGEAINLGNLGDAHRDKQDLPRAVDYFQRALTISKDIQDRRGSGINLGRLGDAYREQGDYANAVEHLNWALNISREIGDKRGEAINLGRLGDAYREQKQFPHAINFHERALMIARQMEDKRGEAYGLLNLGVAYSDMGKFQQAIDSFQAARDIFVALGARHRVEWLDERIAQARSG